jgi:hypothetical protein
MTDDITWNGKWGGQPTQSDALIERCATIAEQYEHAWGEGNNPICGLIAADIRALKDRAALQEQSK